MCGIAGIVGAGAQPELALRMSEALAHRGPDGDGQWSQPGVALGHRRLKILDLSDAGRQPMSTPDGRYTIIFNGEVYNYKELRQELPCEFRSQTDTEVLLQAYAHWGPACLDKTVGMFAFAIWDAVERELFCARDRLGIKPFYYAHHNGDFLFASELRALLTAGVPARPNAGVLFDFLARDFYEHNDDTFFAGIYKLPPGHHMLVRDGRIQRIRRYWHLGDDANQHTGSQGQGCPWHASAEEREETLLQLAADAVRLHLRSDVPIGVALSGGLDSATLLKLLDQVHSQPTNIAAFSFAFAEPAYSERPFVEEMARQTGRPAHFVTVSAAAFAETAERFCVSQEEPFAGAPISAYALCYELARRHGFIVMMDGSGIDEGLAGYGRFLPAFWADLRQAGKLADLDRELYAAGVHTPEQRRRAEEQMRAAAQPGADVGKGQDLTASVRPDCLADDFALTARQPLPEFERPFPDCLRNLMYRELRYTKLPRALRFRDRLSMAVGIELRPPFLDHRLLAYTFTLPAEDHIHQGVSKAILRRAAARLLPDAVRLASKRSVQTPQREWFRNELQDWVRERIDTASFWQRGWVDKRRGQEAMRRFFDGEGDNSFFLWQWINLEIWAREFLDAPSATGSPAVGCQCVSSPHERHGQPTARLPVAHVAHASGGN